MNQRWQVEILQMKNIKVAGTSGIIVYSVSQGH
jgi:hypothetical protein